MKNERTVPKKRRKTRRTWEATQKISATTFSFFFLHLQFIERKMRGKIFKMHDINKILLTFWLDREDEWDTMRLWVSTNVHVHVIRKRLLGKWKMMTNFCWKFWHWNGYEDNILSLFGFVWNLSLLLYQKHMWWLMISDKVLTDKRKMREFSSFWAFLMDFFCLF